MADMARPAHNNSVGSQDKTQALFITSTNIGPVFPYDRANIDIILTSVRLYYGQHRTMIRQQITNTTITRK